MESGVKNVIHLKQFSSFIEAALRFCKAGGSIFIIKFTMALPSLIQNTNATLDIKIKPERWKELSWG